MAKSRTSATTDPPGGTTRSIPTRASTSKKPTEMTREELVGIGKTETDVQTLREAINFLTKASYVSDAADPLDLGMISLILLQIAQAAGNRMSRPSKDAIRSVALILEDYNAQRVANAVTKMVKEDMMRPLSRIEHVGAKADDIVGAMQEETSNLMEATRENFRILNHNQHEMAEYERHISLAASKNKQTMEETTKAFQNISEKCLQALDEKVKNVTESLERRIKDLADYSATHQTCTHPHPHPHTHPLTSQPPQSSLHSNPPPRPGSGPSYRDVAAAGRDQRGDNNQRVTWEDLERDRNISWSDDPVKSRIEAQVELRERQLLINIQEGGTLANMGHLLIVEKANEGLERLSPPERLRGSFKTATHLRNGKGVLLEANGAEVLAWIRTEGRRDAFATYLEREATIRDRTYPVTINFVPITYRPHLDADLREIEEINGFKKGEIASAKWYKPEHRRAEGQRYAHCLFHFSTPETANLVLRNGISICHKRVFARKKKKEPIRCLKCQCFGHIAYSCSSPIDICGTCTGNHRSESCQAYMTLRCANCGDQGNGHASWSRDCPTFRRKCQELDDRTPENNMPYFPTARVWTHVTEPSERAPPPPPPPHPPATHPSHATHTHLLSNSRSHNSNQPMHQFKDPSGIKQSTLPFNFLPKSVKDIISKSIEETPTITTTPKSTSTPNEPQGDPSALPAPAIPTLMPPASEEIDEGDSIEGLYINDTNVTNGGRQTPSSHTASELEVHQTIVDDNKKEVIDLK
jgi:hypothetical protein